MNKLMKLSLGAVFCAGALISGQAIAGDPEAGKQKSATCVACHGDDGNSELTMNPRIAGQYADYIEHVLREYRSGARQNAIMNGMAAALTDEDIADLAAHYSSQSGLQILPDGPND